MVFSSEWVTEHLNIGNEVRFRILLTVAAFVIIVVLRFIAIRVMLKRVGNNKDRYYYTRAVKYIINGVFIVSIFIIWISEFKSFACRATVDRSIQKIHDIV